MQKEKNILKSNFKLSKAFNFIGIISNEKAIVGQILYNYLNLLEKKVVYIRDNKVLFNGNQETVNEFDIILWQNLLQAFKENNIEYIILEQVNTINETILKNICFKNVIINENEFGKNIKDYKKLIKIFNKSDCNFITDNENSLFFYIKRKIKKLITIGKNAEFNITSYNYYQNKSLIVLEHLYDTFNLSIPFLGKNDIYDFIKVLALLLKLDFDLVKIINLTSQISPILGHNQIINTSKGTIIINDVDDVKEIILKCNSKYYLITDQNIFQNLILNNLASIIYVENEDYIGAIKKGIKKLKKNEYLLILGNYQKVSKAIKIIKKT